MDDRFTIKGFQQTILQHLDALPPISLQYTDTTTDSARGNGASSGSAGSGRLRAREVISLNVYTSVRMFSVPLYVFHGALEVRIVDGMGPVGDDKVIIFHNTNPIAISILEMTTTSPGALLSLLSLHDPRNNHHPLTPTSAPPLTKKRVESKVVVDADWSLSVLLSLSVKNNGGDGEEEVDGGEVEVKVRTSHESFSVLLHWKKHEFSLKFLPSSNVKFPSTFPGRSQSTTIDVASFFGYPIEVSAKSEDDSVLAVLRKTQLHPTTSLATTNKEFLHLTSFLILPSPLLSIAPILLALLPRQSLFSRNLNRNCFPRKEVWKILGRSFRMAVTVE